MKNLDCVAVRSEKRVMIYPKWSMLGFIFSLGYARSFGQLFMSLLLFAPVILRVQALYDLLTQINEQQISS